MEHANRDRAQTVQVPAGGVTLTGDLHIPAGASGLVLFAHGSGSGRHSPRNRFVAEQLQRGGLATLLIDLLTPAEEEAERFTRHLRFDIPLLADRLAAIAGWLAAQPATARLALGCFGASTGGGAALVAAAARPEQIRAVVSRGGRPDLAGAHLAAVRAPTLLIVGGRDREVLALNREALGRLAGARQLTVVEGATHLFEEPGALEAVADLARDWFQRYLAPAAEARSVAG